MKNTTGLFTISLLAFTTLALAASADDEGGHKRHGSKHRGEHALPSVCANLSYDQCRQRFPQEMKSMHQGDEDHMRGGEHDDDDHEDYGDGDDDNSTNSPSSTQTVPQNQLFTDGSSVSAQQN